MIKQLKSTICALTISIGSAFGLQASATECGAGYITYVEARIIANYDGKERMRVLIKVDGSLNNINGNELHMWGPDIHQNNHKSVAMQEFVSGFYAAANAAYLAGSKVRIAARGNAVCNNSLWDDGILRMCREDADCTF